MPSNPSERPSAPAVTADDAISLVHRWVTESSDELGRGRRGTPEDERLRGLLTDPQGLDFAVGFVDRVMRPEDLRVAGRNLEGLSRHLPAFLPWHMRIMLQLGGGFGPLAPWLVVPIARMVFRRLVSHLVLDASPKRLDKSLALLRHTGARLNLTLLGEAVLGDAEAQGRLRATEELLARDDVDCISIKVSAVSSQLNLWGFDEAVERIVTRLTPLYEAAATSASTKFINLDMEEFRDLDLTIAVFQKMLDQPRMKSLEAGITVQAYLPEALSAVQHLTEWALARRSHGDAGIKIRLVKGANLAMERADAIMHGWPLATFSSKQQTDTNYKRILDWSFTRQRTDAVRVGVASQNLFDIAYAWLFAQERGVDRRVEFEMLMGMSTRQADAVRTEVGGLLLYAPVVHPAEFDSAIGYLIRRLQENAGPDNFLSSAFELAKDRHVFMREAERFTASLRALEQTPTAPEPASPTVPPHTNRTQDRRRPVAQLAPFGTFVNEPDTDVSRAGNREWGRAILQRAQSSDVGEALLERVHVTETHVLDGLIERSAEAGAEWGQRRASTRAQVLVAAAESLGDYRAALVEVMASEIDATLGAGDAEVSAAIDSARYYADRAPELDRVENVRYSPSRLVVVTPSWSEPVAFAAGSVLAALAAGSAVILAPAPQARRCAAVLVDALWAAGVPREVLGLVDLSGSENGEGSLRHRLATHPEVGRVILAASWEAAKSLKATRAELPLIGQTGGKNAIVVTPSADLELAVADVVRSAFTHAGQKSSAASLVILVGSVGRSDRFLGQLVDAVKTLRIGYATDPTTTMGPLIEPPRGAAREALTSLDGDESWLVRPRTLDESDRLWSPGVRDGVAPGSPFHLTGSPAPVLGIMRARDLDEAIHLQNATGFGLTAGIQSQDATEVALWLKRVEAGNLYVNRSMASSLVQRQPFGGWKRSSVGTATKSGGPNFLLSLGDWAPVHAEPSTSVRLQGVSDRVTRLIEAAQPSMDFAQFDQARRAALSDQHAWESEYGVARDVANLVVERNILRYLPAPVTIRLAEGASASQLVRMLAAATLVDAHVSISSAVPLGSGLVRLFGTASSPVRVTEVLIESDARWHARLQSALERPSRIRLLGGSAAALAGVLDGDPDVTIFAGPVTASGRIELLAFLREQSVSITAHRLGGPDSAMLTLQL